MLRSRDVLRFFLKTAYMIKAQQKCAKIVSNKAIFPFETFVEKKGQSQKYSR